MDVRLDCRKAVKFGDTIEIASRIAEFRRSSFDVDHRITIDAELAVAGSETRDRGGTRALIILAEIIARFEQPWYLLSPARGSRLVRFDRIA